MDKITFNDYESPAVGADNLNQMQTNIEKAIYGTVLYSNLSGTTGNITFSENISNGDSIEIIYRYNNSYKSTGKIPFTSGMNIMLDIQNREDSTAHSSRNKSINVTTSSITVNNEQTQIIWNNNYLAPSIVDSTAIAIMKVVAYK